MKLAVTILILMCLTASVRAQDSTKKFGFYAGVTTLQYKKNGYKNPYFVYTYSFSPRITFGAGWHFPVFNPTSLKLLFFIQDKGVYATRDAPETYEYDGSLSEHLIQLIIQPQFHFWLTSFLSPFVGVQAGVTVIEDCECRYPILDFTLATGASVSLGKGWGLTGAFLVTPYAIKVSSNGFIANEYKWRGAQILLSYEY